MPYLSYKLEKNQKPDRQPHSVIASGLFWPRRNLSGQPVTFFERVASLYGPLSYGGGALAKGFLPYYQANYPTIREWMDGTIFLRENPIG